MNRQEVSERYRIPMRMLQEYENRALHEPGREYGEADLERLSMMMTLRNLGFDDGEADFYMRLLAMPGSQARRLRMLDEKREAALDEIHRREHQLRRLDHLRRELQKGAAAQRPEPKE